MNSRARFFAAVLVAGALMSCQDGRAVTPPTPDLPEAGAPRDAAPADRTTPAPDSRPPDRTPPPDRTGPPDQAPPPDAWVETLYRPCTPGGGECGSPASQSAGSTEEAAGGSLVTEPPREPVGDAALEEPDQPVSSAATFAADDRAADWTATPAAQDTHDASVKWPAEAVPSLESASGGVRMGTAAVPKTGGRPLVRVPPASGGQAPSGRPQARKQVRRLPPVDQVRTVPSDNRFPRLPESPIPIRPKTAIE